MLVDFLWEHCTYLHQENTKEDVRKEVTNDLYHRHIVYTTDEKGLTGVCRFSIYGDLSRILDVAVRYDKRGSGILEDLLKYGLTLYPSVKALQFHSISKKREFTIPVRYLKINKEK